jgi:hypothetical protein
MNFCFFLEKSDAISLAAGAATAKYGENPPKEDLA